MISRLYLRPEGMKKAPGAAMSETGLNIWGLRMTGKGARDATAS
jgi:hypothetical protein